MYTTECASVHHRMYQCTPPNVATYKIQCTPPNVPVYATECTSVHHRMSPPIGTSVHHRMYQCTPPTLPSVQDRMCQCTPPNVVQCTFFDLSTCPSTPVSRRSSSSAALISASGLWAPPTAARRPRRTFTPISIRFSRSTLYREPLMKKRCTQENNDPVVNGGPAGT